MDEGGRGPRSFAKEGMLLLGTSAARSGSSELQRPPNVVSSCYDVSAVTSSPS